MGEINSYVSGNEVLLARICVPFDENMAIFCPIIKKKGHFYLIILFMYVHCTRHSCEKINYVILSADVKLKQTKY